MKKGFTLLELIIVIIILGILATLGFTQYTKVVEKGRTGEAKMILGTIRSAQEAYYLENDGAYTATIGNLSVEAPAACTATHYFTYGTTATAATATRCTSGGKAPQGPAAYTVTLTFAGQRWGGSAGYY